MLTKLRVKNFKRFDEVEVELGESVVLVGPNNSGKTSVLQVLALWEAGLRRWSEKRSDKPTPRQRPGVTINRRDLVSLPVATARALWRGLRVRDVSRTDEGKTRTQNVLIEITVSGVTDDKAWECGFELDYANEESISILVRFPCVSARAAPPRCCATFATSSISAPTIAGAGSVIISKGSSE